MWSGVTFAAIGMAVVFSVLVALVGFIALIRRIDDRWQARERGARQAATEREQTIDDLTLVLIAAAVATVVGGRGRIRGIRRLLPSDAAASVWSTQGRATLMGSHVITRQSGGRRS